MEELYKEKSCYILIHLGVDEETATQDACRIEHVISDESFQALKAHAAKWRG